MVFNIRKNATLPILRLALYNDGRDTYKKFQENLPNAAITFSMRDVKTGVYKVANKPGVLYLKDPCTTDSEPEYYIGYQFTSNDTDTCGVFEGQFKLQLVNIDNTLIGELITPIREDLFIHINDSFNKSQTYYE